MLKLKWNGPKKLTCPKHTRFNPAPPSYHGPGQIKAGCLICQALLDTQQQLENTVTTSLFAQDLVADYKNR